MNKQPVGAEAPKPPRTPEERLEDAYSALKLIEAAHPYATFHATFHETQGVRLYADIDWDAAKRFVNSQKP